jgi:hypothetical protein
MCPISTLHAMFGETNDWAGDTTGLDSEGPCPHSLKTLKIAAQLKGIHHQTTAGSLTETSDLQGMLGRWGKGWPQRFGVHKIYTKEVKLEQHRRRGWVMPIRCVNEISKCSAPLSRYRHQIMKPPRRPGPGERGRCCHIDHPCFQQENSCRQCRWTPCRTGCRQGTRAKRNQPP